MRFWLIIFGFLSLLLSNSTIFAQENAASRKPDVTKEDQQNPKEKLSVAEKIANWQGLLLSSEQALGRSGAEVDDLESRTSETKKIRRDALQLQQELQPQIDQLKEQLTELGPAVKEGEPAESELIANKRKEIERQFSLLDGELKAVGLIAVRAAQIENTIIENRRSRFTRELSRLTTSVFDPDLWKSAWSGMAGIGARFSLLLSDSFSVMRDRLEENPLLAVVLLAVTVMVALFGYFANTWLERRAERLRTATNPSLNEQKMDEQRMDRQIQIRLAGLMFLRRALLPGLAIAIIYFTFVALNLFTQRLQEFVFHLTGSLITIVIVRSLARAYLAPNFARRRFLPMSDNGASKIYQLISVGIFLLVAFRLLNKTAIILISPFELTVAISALGALVCLTIAMLALWSISVGKEDNTNTIRLVGGEEREGNLIRWGLIGPFLWLAVLAGFVALALGYLAFAEFISVQLVIAALIFSVAWLTIEFLDLHRDRYLDVESGHWRQLSRLTGFSRQTVLQTSVFGFGFTKLSIIVISAIIFMVSWGYRANDWTGSLRDAFFGFQVGGLSISFSSIVLAIFLFVIGYLLARAIQNWLQKQFLPTTKMEQGLQNSIATIFGYIGIVIAALLAITAAGLDLSKVAIVAGALSVGIGFGLQSIVNNFVSGLILLAERPIKSGDWIVTSGGQGTVRKTSVRSTEIETFDGATVIVPNSTLITDTVTNWTHHTQKGRIIVAIGVSYDSNPEQVRDILLACADAHERIINHPKATVFFQDFGADALMFELRAYLANINNAASTKSDLRFAIFNALREANIEIPFPQRDIHIKSAPAPLIENELAETKTPTRKRSVRKST